MDEFKIPVRLRRLAEPKLAAVGPPSRSAAGAKAGGARRNRTDDLLLAKQALSQLSYGPLSRSQQSVIGNQTKARVLITDF
jgi:hypothetical protein